MPPVIETQKLTKAYGKFRGIVDVDLTVNEGEIFGFLGPNGAGKTTTIRVLLDLIKPTSGSATVFGIEAAEDPVAIHRRLGYLPGEWNLYDRLSGAETIRYFANLRGGVDKAYSDQLVQRLDLDPSRRFREYSKGNKQKVGLVVALQHKPELLILDEPTSGLDPLVQQTFNELLFEARREGRTVFLSSHIISEVERTCDRVAIIREGRIVRVDTVEGVRNLAAHEVELRFAEPVAPAAVRGHRGRAQRRGRGPDPANAGHRPDRARGPPRGPARPRRLRQPRAVARGGLPLRVRASRRRDRDDDGPPDDRRRSCSRRRGADAGAEPWLAPVRARLRVRQDVPGQPSERDRARDRHRVDRARDRRLARERVRHDREAARDRRPARIAARDLPGHARRDDPHRAPGRLPVVARHQLPAAHPRDLDGRRDGRPAGRRAEPRQPRPPGHARLAGAPAWPSRSSVATSSRSS